MPFPAIHSFPVHRLPVFSADAAPGFAKRRRRCAAAPASDASARSAGAAQITSGSAPGAAPRRFAAPDGGRGDAAPGSTRRGGAAARALGAFLLAALAAASGPSAASAAQARWDGEIGELRLIAGRHVSRAPLPRVANPGAVSVDHYTLAPRLPDGIDLYARAAGANRHRYDSRRGRYRWTRWTSSGHVFLGGTPSAILGPAAFTLRAHDSYGAVLASQAFTIEVVGDSPPEWTRELGALSFTAGREAGARIETPGIAHPRAEYWNSSPYVLSPRLPEGMRLFLGSSGDDDRHYPYRASHGGGAYAVRDRPNGAAGGHPRGFIGGTPTRVQGPTVYTLTAVDRIDDMPTVQTFTIEVVAPSESRPEPGPLAFAAGASIGDREWAAGAATAPAVLPRATGGTGAIRYSFDPPLPDGLSFDRRTRILSGTPGPGAKLAGEAFRYVARDSAAPSPAEVSLGFAVTVANAPPVADAGPDRAVNAGDDVILNGTGSSDAETAKPAYSWEQTGGTAVSLSGADTPTPSFAAPAATDARQHLAFRLTVTDEAGQAATDDVAITVRRRSPDPRARWEREAGDLRLIVGRHILRPPSGHLPRVANPDAVAVDHYTLGPRLPEGVDLYLRDAGAYKHRFDPVRNRYRWDASGKGYVGSWPTRVQAPAVYTLRAHDERGTVLASQEFVVEVAKDPPPDWTFHLGALRFTAGEEIAPRIETPGIRHPHARYWARDDYVLSPRLPEGMVLFREASGGDGSYPARSRIGRDLHDGGAYGIAQRPDGAPGRHPRGFIGGTPARAQDPTVYTLTAIDDLYEIPAVQTFTIEIVAPPESRPAPLAFAPDASVGGRDWEAGTAIAPLVLPEAAGGTGAIRYSFDPPLPDGLSFDQGTRTLSGTPGPGVKLAEAAFRYVARDSAAPSPAEVSLGFAVAVANAPPVADAGPDFLVHPALSFDLDGSGSRDPEGGALAYRWWYTLPGGEARDLGDEATVLRVLMDWTITRFAFHLTVTDAAGQEATDEVVVTRSGRDRPSTDIAEPIVVELVEATLSADESGDALPPCRHLPCHWPDAHPLADEGDGVAAEVNVRVRLGGAIPEGGLAEAIEIPLLVQGARGVASGAAVAGADYSVRGTGAPSVTFHAGAADGAVATLAIDLLADAIVEGDETFSVAIDEDGLPDGVEVAAASPAETVVTIGDATEAVVGFSGGATALPESASLGVFLMVHIDRLMGIDEGIGIGYATADGTAVAGTDYVAVTDGTARLGREVFTVPGHGGPYSLAATDEAKDRVPIWIDLAEDDFAADGDKTFTVTLSMTAPAGTNVSLGDGTGAHGLSRTVTVTIEDDDAAPSFAGVGTPRSLDFASGADIGAIVLDAVDHGTGAGEVSYALDLASLDRLDRAGLAFDPATRRLTGTPAASAHVPASDGAALAYTATDQGPNAPAAISYPIVIANDAPVAEAGAARTVAGGARVTLAGSGSDKESLPGALTFAWTTIPADAANVTGEDTATLAFDAPAASGEDRALTFALTVTDEAGRTATDDVTVTVTAALAFDGTAGDLDWRAGDAIAAVTLPAATGGVGQIRYSLDPALPAGASFDPATREIAGTLGAGLAPSTGTFTYAASDGDEDTPDATLTFAITVANAPPGADAGPDQTVDGGDAVTLDGSGSSDAETAEPAYSWEQTGGPSVTLAGADTPTPTFAAPAPLAGARQELAFRLTVTDEAGQAAVDHVRVTVRPGAGNARLTVSAGSDRIVDGGDAVSLNGTESSDLKTWELDFRWEQTGGPSVSLSGADTPTPAFTAPAATDAYQDLAFRVTVTNASGAAGTDDVVVTVRRRSPDPRARWEREAGDLRLIVGRHILRPPSGHLPRIANPDAVAVDHYTLGPRLPEGVDLYRRDAGAYKHRFDPVRNRYRWDASGKGYVGSWPTRVQAPAVYTLRAHDERGTVLASQAFVVEVAKDPPPDWTSRLGALRFTAGEEISPRIETPGIRHPHARYWARDDYVLSPRLPEGMVLFREASGGDGSYPARSRIGRDLHDGGAYGIAQRPDGAPGRHPRGFIGGTPARAQDPAVYTLTAIDDLYEIPAVQTFTIEIVAPPGSAPAPLAFAPDASIGGRDWEAGTAIAPLVLPEATGGTGAIRYSFDPPLPDGLSFDQGTRTLSGTPGPGVKLAEEAFRYVARDSAAPSPAEVSLGFAVAVANAPPVADAGPDFLVHPALSFDLDGSGSRDPEGGALAYRWWYILPGGEARDLGDEATVLRVLMDWTITRFAFQLTVTDAAGQEATDEVVVTRSGLRRPSTDIADQEWEVGERVSLSLPTWTGGLASHDYTLAPALPAGLSFDPGANPPVIAGTPTEALERTTFAYGVTDATGRALAAPLTFDVEIVPVLALAGPPRPVGEGAGAAVFTAALNAPGFAAVTVDWATEDGTAAAPSDYAAARGTLTFAPGQTTRSFPVVIADDGMDEDDETFAVRLSNPSEGAALGDASAVEATIEDDDDAPTATLTGPASVTEGDAATLTVTLSGASGLDVTVALGSEDGAATADDYTGPSGTLTIPAGDTSGRFQVATIEDALDEADEGFAVTIADAHGVVLARHEVTILDDDDAPKATLTGPATVTEGDVATFAVTLSGASGLDVTVTLGSEDGAATAPGDYAAPSGTLIIPAGGTSGGFQVNTIEDALDEADEGFAVTVADAHGTVLDRHEVTILDDDDAPTASFDAPSQDVAEGEAATVTVALSAPSGLDVTVTLGAEDGAATAPEDYTAPSGTLTIPAGDTSGSFQVATVEDALDESDETFLVTIADADGTVLDSHALTIEDADTPAVGFAPAVLSISEAGGPVMVQVAVDPAPYAAFAVDYAVAPGTADADDYSLPQGLARNGTLIIAPGASTKEIGMFAAVDDDVDETVESFTVTLGNPTAGAALSDSPTLTVIIEDDDGAPTVSFDAASQGVGEGDGEVRLTAVLTNPSAADITVRYAVNDVSATAGMDYQAPPGELTIPAGDDRAEIVIALRDDALDESDESFAVTLLAADQGVTPGAVATQTVTILDDDDAPTASFDAPSQNVAEGEAATVTVALSAPSGLPVTVALGSEDGTAAAPGDYAAPTGTLTIPAGDASGSFQVATVEDALDEADETFAVTIADGHGVVLARHEVTIMDDDAAPTATLTGPASVTEGDAATLTVTLDGASGLPVTVTLGSEDGAAAAPEDYTAPSGTLTIPAGGTSGSFDVATAEDALDEADEGFAVTIADGHGAVLDRHEVTIEDDDAAPTATLSGPASVAEGDAATLTVTLSGASGLDVTVTLGAEDGAATAPEDYTAPTGTLTIPAGGTSRSFDVATVEDALDETDEAFAVTIADGHGTVLDRHEVAILDDDAAPGVALSGPASVTEGDAATITVTLDAASGLDVTVTLGAEDGAATADDYTAPSGTLTIPAGGTSRSFDVATVEDALDEADETFAVIISDAHGVVLDRHEVTILDDDAAPDVALTGPATVTEGDVATLTVTLDGASGLDVTVTLGAEDGTAAADDYTAPSGTLTIPAGGTSGSFDVATIEDALDEADEGFAVTIADGHGTVLDRHEVTILDDDAAPTATLTGPASVTEGDAAILAVTLSGASGLDVTVTLGAEDGAATADDYTAPTGTLTIPAGGTSGSFQVATAEDALDEADEGFAVTIADGRGTVLDRHEVTIVDDDAAPGVALTGPASVTEGETATLTVTLSGASGLDVTVALGAEDGAATADDYAAPSGTLTIPAGGTSRSFDVATVEDALDEADETFAVIISDAHGVVLDRHEVTILDDDAAPDVALTGPATVTEGDVATLTVTLDGASGLDVTVTLGAEDGTAAADDYTAPSGTLTIPAGGTSRNFDVATIEDALDEADEGFAVTIADGHGTVLDRHEVTILDDDAAPTATLTGPASVTEGDAAILAVTLSGASGLDVTVTLGAEDGAATADDYTAPSGTLTIPAGSTSRSFDVATVEDALDEADETFAVIISDAHGVVLDRHEVTILDDDAAPGVALSGPASVTEGDTATFTVTLSGASGLDVTVALGAEDGAATADDYAAPSGTLTIPAGGTSRSFDVATVEDALDEADETFAVTIADAHGAVLDRHEVAILDDDAAPTAALSGPAGVTEGDAATITVTLDAASGLDVTVTLGAEDGTAAAPEDYTAPTGTLTIPAGDASGTFQVATAEDALDEADETFAVTIADGHGAVLDRHEVTILDDDAAPGVALSGPASVTEGETATLAVTLSGASGLDVTVALGAEDGAATAPDDYTAPTGTLTIPAGGTSRSFDVTTVEDALDEADEGFAVTIADGHGTVLDRHEVTILDDDAAPGVTLAGPASVTEGETVTLAVTLSGASGLDVTVTLGAEDGAATAPEDYAAPTGTLTIPAGDTSGSFRVATVEDALDEADEGFAVTIADGHGAVLARHEVTIVDDDAAPTATLSGPATVTEGGAAVFTVTLNAASGLDVTVTPGSRPGTAEAADYDVPSTALTIAAGERTATFEVAVAADGVDEPDESLTVTIAGADGTELDSRALTIEDADTPVVGFAAAAAFMSETGGSVTIEVAVAPVSHAAFAVDYAVAPGTARAGDYVLPPGMAATGRIDVPAGASTVAIGVVSAVDDDVDETDETFTVTLAGQTGGAALGQAVLTITILDDDGAPTVSFDVASQSVGEGDGEVRATAVLSHPSASDISVLYTVSDVSAAAGTDYALPYASPPGALTIPAGDRRAQAVIALRDDALDEVDESFTVTLVSADQGVTPGAVAAQTVTILDDDDAPTATLAGPASVTEGETAILTVALSGASGLDVTVTPGAEDGTATAPDDYTAPTGTLTIPAGDLSGTFQVATVEDALDEADEGFAVTIADGHGAVLDRHGITILDDDAAPTAALTGPATVTEGDAATLVVTLDGASGLDVTVTLGAEDGAAVAPEDYAAPSGTLTIPAGGTSGTFQVATVEDALDESDESFAVTVADADGTVLDRHEVAILDDDDAPAASFAASSQNVAEGDAATLAVTLSGASGLDVTVTLGAEDGAATAPDDYTAPTGTLTIPAGGTSGTFQVATVEDALDEADEGFAVTISDADGAVLGRHEVTIIDDDDAPGVTLAGPASVTEGDAVTLTVTLDGASGLPVTVTLGSEDGAATAPEDYAAPTGTLTIPVGDASGSFQVATVEDALDEADETFAVTIAGADGTVLDRHEVAIFDDDDAPAASFAAPSQNVAEGEAATLTVTLSAPSGLDVTVTLGAEDGTATAPEDYTAPSGELTIPAGGTSRSFQVATVEDALDEADETFAVTIADAAGAVLDRHEVAIIDDDAAPTVALSGPAGVAEGEAATLTVTLSAPSGLDVTVALGAEDGAATAPDDYAAPSGTLTIPAGDRSASFDVATVEDALEEADERFAVTIADAAGTVLDRHELAILDDDEALAFVPAPPERIWMILNEPFSRVLPPAAGARGEVVYDLGGDLPAGIAFDRDTRTLSGTPTEESKGYPGEAGAVHAYVATSANGASVSAGIYIEVAFLAAPVQVVTDGAARKHSEAGDYAFWIDAGDHGLGHWIEVGWETVDGTATAGEDYVAASGTVRVRDGGEAGVGGLRVIDLLDDRVIGEPEETFEIRLTILDGPGYVLRDGVVTIADNDPPVSFAPDAAVGGLEWRVGEPVSMGPLPAARRGTGTYVYSVSPTLPQGVAFDPDTRMIAGTPTRAFERAAFAYAATDDAARYADPALASARLEFGIEAIPTLALSGPARVGEGDGAAVFTATLNAAASADVTVEWETGGGTATAERDYAPAGGALRIPAGAAAADFEVAIVDDGEDEADEAFEVALTNPSANAALGDRVSAAVAILDDDDAPTASFAVPSQDVAEGEAATVVVTLDAASGLDVTVALGAEDGAATAPDDYAAPSGTLTIPAGATSASFDVATAGDALDEADETFAVTIADAAGAVLDRHEVTILDDDDAPGAALAGPARAAEGGTATFTVTLDAVSGLDVILAPGSRPGTASAADYGVPPAALTIPAGQRTAAFDVALAADGVDEPDETFEVIVSDAEGAELDSREVTIEDADVPVVGFASAAASMPETGGSVTVEVAVDPAPHAAIAVGYAVAPGTAGAGDYVLPPGLAATGTLTIPPGASRVAIGAFAAVDDDVDEGDETFTVTLGGPAGGARLGGATLTVTIADDDTALSFAPGASVGDRTDWAAGKAVPAGPPLPKASGGEGAIGYSFEPPLPDGVSFDAAARVFSGAPAAGARLDAAPYEYVARDSAAPVPAMARLPFRITVANAAPVADAGDGQDVRSGAPVTLDGSRSSDPEKGRLAFEWSVPGGAALAGADTATPSFRAPKVNEASESVRAAAFLFATLKVTDEAGLASVDTVQVRVVERLSFAEGARIRDRTRWRAGRAVRGGTRLPAAAGGYGEVRHSFRPALPDGIAFDQRTRTFSGAPAASVKLEAAPYEYVAADASSAPSGARLPFRITVANAPPTADAGADQAVAGGGEATLDGSSSSDPEGGRLSLAWTAPPGVALSDASAASPTFAPPAPTGGDQALEFVLTVTDEAGQSASDSVTVTVLAGAGEEGPAALSGEPAAAGDDDAALSFAPGASVGDRTDWAAGKAVPAGSPLPKASGGKGAIGYSFEPPLPDGVSFDAAARVFSGAPAAGVRLDAAPYDYVARDSAAPVPAVARLPFRITVANAAPVADAGDGKDVRSGAPVTLDGSRSSDPEKGRLAFEWSVPGGGAVAGADTATPSFRAPKADEAFLLATLKVTDEAGLESVDTVRVTVVERLSFADGARIRDRTRWRAGKAVGGRTRLPAAAGGHGEIRHFFRPALPDGIAFDQRTRTFSGAPAASVKLEAAPYEYVAADASSAPSGARLPFRITVANAPPTADAGADQAVAGGDEATLDGSSSSDPEGGRLSRAWTAPPGVTLSDASAARPTFAAPAPTGGDRALEFVLTVTDEAGQSASDAVTVTVLAGAGEEGPAAPSGDPAAAGEAGPAGAAGGDDAPLTLGPSGGHDAYAYCPGNGAGPCEIRAAEPLATTAPWPEPEPPLPRLVDSSGRPVTALTVGEDEGSASFTLELVLPDGARELREDVAIGWRAVEGTAREPEDYQAGGGERVTFLAGAAGEELRREFQVGIVQDGVEEPDESFSIELDGAPTALAVTITDAREPIGNFIGNRMQSLLSNQPRLARFLDQGNGGGLSADMGDGRASLSGGFRAGPAWGEFSASRTETGGDERGSDGSDASHAFAAFGIHWPLSERALGGVMVQLDRAREDIVDGGANVGEVEGAGWLAGPYFAARHAAHPLRFEGRLLYGRSGADFAREDGDGRVGGAFDSARWLAQLRAEGDARVLGGGVSMAPFLDASYASDRAEGFTDSQGRSVSGQSATLARLEAGVGFAIPVAVDRGAMTLRPGASLVVSDARGDVAAGSDQGMSVRGRLEFGMDVARSENARLSLKAFYDGIGSPGYESYGVTLGLDFRF